MINTVRHYFLIVLLLTLLYGKLLIPQMGRIIILHALLGVNIRNMNFAQKCILQDIFTHIISEFLIINTKIIINRG